MIKKHPINIFIVEDNNIFIQALKAEIEATFSNMYIKIYFFETGEKCMNRFLQVMPELVILDYHLNTKYPDAADGIKVLDWIKKENIQTNVIMLSNEDNIDIAIESFKHGASDYVVKTETMFKKINYSLFNLFKMMEAKSEARRYKHLVVGLYLFIALLVGGAIAIRIFTPSFLK